MSMLRAGRNAHGQLAFADQYFIDMTGEIVVTHTMNAPEIADPFRLWISIIGMGAAGSSHLGAIINRAIETGLNDAIGVNIIDSRAEVDFGRGIAWTSSQSHSFRANMRFHTIGFSQKILDRIMNKLGVTTIEDFESLPDSVLFANRTIIGEALHEDYIDNVDRAKKYGIPITVYARAGAIDIRKFSSGIEIVLENGKSVFTHYITLALGNQPKQSLSQLRGREGYIYNPWDWSKYDSITQESRVAIIGMGPTAVDSILKLDEIGVKSISAFSRTGRVQHPRPRGQPVTLTELSAAKIKSLADIHRANGREGLHYEVIKTFLLKEFHSHQACDDWNADLKYNRMPARQALFHGLANSEAPRAWYGILKSIDVVTPLIWWAMDESSRATYMEEDRGDHTNMSYGMASVQARRLSDRIEERTLSIHRGLEGESGVKWEDGEFVVTYRIGDDETSSDKSDRFDFVINCTGIGSDVETMDSDLVKAMLKGEWIIPYKGIGRGIVVDFETGSVLSGGGHPRGSLYSLTGSLTLGTHLLTNCIWQVWQSSERTAQAILVDIANRVHTR